MLCSLKDSSGCENSKKKFVGKFTIDNKRYLAMRDDRFPKNISKAYFDKKKKKHIRFRSKEKDDL